MADFDHPHGQLGVLDRVDDAVITLANPVPFLAGELFAANGAGVFGKGADSLHDPLQVVFGDGVQVLPDRLLKEDAIDGHWP